MIFLKYWTILLVLTVAVVESQIHAMIELIRLGKMRCTLSEADLMDPEKFCASRKIERYCVRTVECNKYRNEIGCNKDPSVYCTSWKKIKLCRQVENCIKYHDGDVDAVKIG